MYDKMMRKLRQGGNEITTEDQSNLTNEQRIQALANISDQTANANTGKMGYKVLLPGKSFAEQVTEANTIYEIRDVFDLGGTEEAPVNISLPDNVTLRFNGGVLKNVTLIGQRTLIEAPDVMIFDNVTFSGNYTGALNASWVGAVPNNAEYDNSFVIQKWFDSFYSSFKTLEFSKNNYHFLNPVLMTDDRRNMKLDANGSMFYVNIEDDNSGNGQYFLTLQGPLTTGTSGGEQFHLENVRIRNIRKTNSYDISKTCGIMLNRTHRFLFNNVIVEKFDKGIHIRDVFYGGFAGMSWLFENRIGIYADCDGYNEVNTIDFHNITIRGCSSNVAKSLWPQEPGETEESYNMRIAVCGFDFHAMSNGCKFYGCTIEGVDFGFRFNHKNTSSDRIFRGDIVNIDSCYFESNRSYDIFIGEGYMPNPNNYTKRTLFIHDSVISNCRFFTNKKCYFYLGNHKFVGNQAGVSIELKGSSKYGSASLVFDSGVSSVVCGSYCVAKKQNLYISNSRRGDSAAPSTLLDSSFKELALLSNSEGDYLTGSLKCDDNDYANLTPVFIPREGNVGMLPTVKTGDAIMPLQSLILKQDAGISRVFVRSGSGYVGTVTDSSFLRINMASEGITLRTFLYLWSNGTPYTGKVQGLWNYVISSDPDSGLVTNENGSVVGFGKKAILDNTYPRNTGYYLYIDGLIYLRFINSFMSYYADVVQCARTYAELRPSNAASNSNDKNKIRVIGTAAQLANVQKRLNAVYFDTTEEKTKIYNGHEWVELIYPWMRYFYNSFGKSLSQRMSMPDLEGQEYFNKATGIRYTFFLSSSYNPIWLTSIGSVDSLDHPNGYDENSNPLEYATELSPGEQVICNGKRYTWNGASFDGNETYTVTNTLASVTNSNPATSIDGNKTYMATLTPGMEFVIQSVTVTMGGTDVTSFVYNPTTHVIYIASVTGDIVITATAGTPN